MDGGVILRVDLLVQRIDGERVAEKGQTCAHPCKPRPFVCEVRQNTLELNICPLERRIFWEVICGQVLQRIQHARKSRRVTRRVHPVRRFRRFLHVLEQPPSRARCIVRRRLVCERPPLVAATAPTMPSSQHVRPFAQLLLPRVVVASSALVPDRHESHGRHTSVAAAQIKRPFSPLVLVDLQPTSHIRPKPQRHRDASLDGSIRRSRIPTHRCLRRFIALLLRLRLVLWHERHMQHPPLIGRIRTRMVLFSRRHVFRRSARRSAN
mmetsp:Transcript_42535/g.113609  ORF Transcript_42535/g.113609 Transcript_42535/m.113609 type:complete len:266 (-) Transcript_42535:293-1090(-)